MSGNRANSSAVNRRTNAPQAVQQPPKRQQSNPGMNRNTPSRTSKSAPVQAPPTAQHHKHVAPTKHSRSGHETGQDPEHRRSEQLCSDHGWQHAKRLASLRNEHGFRPEASQWHSAQQPAASETS